METITLDKKEHDRITGKLATLEAPAKSGWWRRVWGLRVKAVVVVLAVAFLLIPGVSHALTDKQKALVGLKGVYVLVGSLPPEVKRLGLTEDQIKTDVELRLRKAGVRVLTEKNATPWNPTLFVRVNTYIVGSIDLCIYSITVKLNEIVTIDRGFKVTGTVWDVGAIGTLGSPPEIRFMRKTVGDIIDEFINDYLAVNPK